MVPVIIYFKLVLVLPKNNKYFNENISIIFLETDASLQSGGGPPHQQPGMVQQAQFRQPLPPNAAGGVGPMPPGSQVRIMNPNMPAGMRPNGPPGPPGSQVSGNNPMTTRPGTFLLVHRQPTSNSQARARMMMVHQQGQIQGQRPPQQQMNPQNNSPLLAQHLSGRMPTPEQQQQLQQQQLQQQQQQQRPQQQQTGPNQNMPPQQQQQPSQQGQQQQQQGQGGDDGNIPDELGDLGVPEEDLLNMGDNFDYLEFADALDDLDNNLPEGGGGGDADKTPASAPASGSAPSDTNNVTSSASAGSTTSQSQPVTSTPPTQPPPYNKGPAVGGGAGPPPPSQPPTMVGNNAPPQGAAPVRGPPPPYPGQQQAPLQQPPQSTTTSKVINFFK